MAKILIIDDDRQFRVMLKQMLERSGYQIIEGESADEGLKKCQDPDIGLLLLDMITPGRDGLEILDDLRALRPEMKIIAMSGGVKGDTSWLEPIAMSKGVCRFMAKPFSKAEIMSAINEVLGA
ncbi:MAG: response regulator [Deltaproteobacteria bacterium]|nr:response regulator [Deltaproteobacteria bacterium]